MNRISWMTGLAIGLFAAVWGLAPGSAFAATGFEAVASDQPEYMKGDTAYVFGNGFQAGSSVVVEVQRPNGSIVTGNGTETAGSDTVTVAANGSFTYAYWLNGGVEAAYEGTFIVRAKDPSAGTVLATTTFLDNPQYGLQGCSRARGDCTDSESPSTGWADGATPINGWTSGVLKGWFELENVPYRLRINLPAATDAKTYSIMNEHDNYSGGVTGIDAGSDFYVGAGVGATGYTEGQKTKDCVFQATRLTGSGPTTSTPCIVTGPTYTGVDDDGDGATDEEIVDGIDNDGDGKIDEDPAPQNGSIKRIQYVWAVLFGAGEAGDSTKKWALYWKGHLAAGSANFPGASLHTNTTATGNQDVPLMDVGAVCSSGCPDLTITKTDAPDPANVGQNLVYTTTVNNLGPGSATGVTVTDSLPVGVTYLSAVPTQGTCSFANPTVTCDLGTIAAGGSASVTITVTPDASAADSTISNSAIVSSNESDPNGANNTSTTTTTINPAADLSITKTDGPDPVLVGADLTYTITVTNGGPNTAVGVTVTDPLPANVTLVSATPSQGGPCTGTTTISCPLGDLANGASATVTIVVTPGPAAAGTLTNTASVTSGTFDQNTTDNTTPPVTTTVNASADLSITKTGSPDPVTAGQNLTYTITATNNGPSAATGVTVTDTLPGGVTFVSATSTQGTCSGTTTVTCAIGTLASGASATVTIVVTPTAAGTLSNTANVSGTEADPDTANNTTPPVTTTVDPSGTDIAISQTVTPNPVDVGLQATFTITVTNNGPLTATGVSLSNTLPTNVTFNSLSTTQGTCTAPSGGTFTCTIGTMANGATVTITLVVTTTTAGMIENTASVSANESETTTTNNSSAVTTNVGDVSRLINISTRGPVLTSPSLMHGGFILGGNTAKRLLIRGRGPSLSGAPFNIGGTLSNPMIDVYSGQTIIAQNNNWQTTDPLCVSPATACGNAADITATGKDPCVPNPGQTSSPPGCTNESAIIMTLPPGAYTVIMSGVNGGTGVGLIEVFDPDGSTLPKLVNISTRGMVQTSPSLMHGGFIIGAGTGSKQVLIRARGPSMSGAPFNIAGTLSNPTIQLYSGQTVIVQNNDWQTTDPLCGTPAQACGDAAQITATGKDPCVPNPGQTVAPPNCGQESAMLVTLPPGAYTMIVSGVGGTTGVGLVEVFELSP